MSRPLKVNKDDSLPTMVQHVLCEVVSAESALNMYPCPIENSEGGYLSQTDEWARHCMEHLRQIFQDLQVIHKRTELIRTYND